MKNIQYLALSQASLWQNEKVPTTTEKYMKSWEVKCVWVKKPMMEQKTLFASYADKRSCRRHKNIINRKKFDIRTLFCMIKGLTFWLIQNWKQASFSQFEYYIVLIPDWLNLAFFPNQFGFEPASFSTPVPVPIKSSFVWFLGKVKGPTSPLRMPLIAFHTRWIITKLCCSEITFSLWEILLTLWVNVSRISTFFYCKFMQL